VHCVMLATAACVVAPGGYRHEHADERRVTPHEDWIELRVTVAVFPGTGGAVKDAQNVVDCARLR